MGAHVLACEGSQTAALNCHNPGLNPGSVPFTLGGLASPVRVGP